MLKLQLFSFSVSLCQTPLTHKFKNSFSFLTKTVQFIQQMFIVPDTLLGTRNSSVSKNLYEAPIYYDVGCMIVTSGVRHQWGQFQIWIQFFSGRDGSSVNPDFFAQCLLRYHEQQIRTQGKPAALNLHCRPYSLTLQSSGLQVKCASSGLPVKCTSPTKR